MPGWTLNNAAMSQPFPAKVFSNFVAALGAPLGIDFRIVEVVHLMMFNE